MEPEGSLPHSQEPATPVPVLSQLNPVHGQRVSDFKQNWKVTTNVSAGVSNLFSQRATTVIVNWLGGGGGRTFKNQSIRNTCPTKLKNYTYYGVLLQKCNVITLR
jgi:hypothetical protein